MTSPGPEMTLVVVSDRPGPRLLSYLEELRRSTGGRRTEIIVASPRDWPEAPAWLKFVAGQGSRGDLLDRACELAGADFLGLLREGVRPGPAWQDRALELLQDPGVVAVGGPQLSSAGAPLRQRAAWLVLSSRLGSGPLTHRFQRLAPKSVDELFTSNLVIRRSTFREVGGFQNPSPRSEEARLGFKLRSLAGGRILCHPDLAVEAELPPLIALFVSQIFGWGRHRGELLRQLPETSTGSAYFALPLALLALVALTVLAVATWQGRVALLVVLCGYLLAGLLMIRRGGPRVGLMAAVALPLAHLAYALGVWRGYLRPSLGVAHPRRRADVAAGDGERMRILIMNWRDVTHPFSGGAETYMHELATRWVALGCRVTWVTQRHRRAPRNEVIDGITFWRRGGAYTQYPLAAWSYLVSRRRRCDVVIDCENGIPFFTPLYCRKPIVLVVHHLHLEVFNRELPPTLRWIAVLVESALMPRVYRRKPIVTVSSSTLADLVASGYDQARINIINNGVQSVDLALTLAKSTTPAVLYLGRLKTYKSVDVLLRAVPQLLADFPDAKVAVAGQGPDRERLERLAWSLGLAASVRFHGYVDAATRRSLLEKAWVVVCPSAFEGFGVVCLEANAHQTPVVAAAVAGLRDAVVEGQTGLLVPYGDSAALASALSDLLGDSGKREQMGKAGRKWASQHDWDESATKFLALLETWVPPASGTAAKDPSAAAGSAA